ncbi:MAG: type I-D CRISPR-associated protein Cas10d/Csc3 [Herpetosiphon sp.]|nr:type I-D CRISPR-associated protein Cas10d/Csc3 [Herpetosiphon sp.]
MDDDYLDDLDEQEIPPELQKLSLTQMELAIGKNDNADSIFNDYLTHVANNGLLKYKFIIHYSETEGGKAGESLYNHVLNGIFTLEQLRPLLNLSADEVRILFTAYTLHDINKLHKGKTNYLKLTTNDAVELAMHDLHLDEFFAGYGGFINDIISLMQRHSGHTWTGANVLNLTTSRFKLHPDRLHKLLTLIRAVDAADLSQTLDEVKHKDTFLRHLNEFVDDQQYDFWTHRVAEQRGSFTNIIHNAAVAEVATRFGYTPLLFYPDGVAYLRPKASKPVHDGTLIKAIATRVAGVINDMTSGGFTDFIRPINMGITVDKKCLDLNLPFAKIFGVIHSIIQRRNLKDEKIQQLTRDSTQRTKTRIAKSQASQPQLSLENLPATDVIGDVQAMIERGCVPQTNDGMRVGELIRSYYIFLIEHFAEKIPHAWQHIYTLLDIPHERWSVYDLFDARMDRAYAIATELPLSEMEVLERILADGTTLLEQRTANDPRLPTLMTYLEQVLTFTGQEHTAHDFAHALPTYVRQQHKQCVQCSLPLPTQKWGSANVRSDIKVQMFSNRLAGGPGEPVKRVCDVCMIQYLVEKLNYREIRGEQTIYLHMFPYSFTTAPMLKGIRSTFRAISQQDALAGAIRVDDIQKTMMNIALENPYIRFTTRTKADKAQPYGIYGPKYEETIAGLITLPLNPAGDTTTDIFLFALQHALIFHHHFGMKVLVSTSATPSLDKEAFGDVYVDLTPLSARGLVRQNDYLFYEPKSQKPGSLQHLWKQLTFLYQIRAVVATAKDDPMVELIGAMADHPLRIFYVAEKQTEAKASHHAGVLMRQIFADIRLLALSVGDPTMSELDNHLRNLAGIARHGNLRGSSWKKSSMITALDEVLRKVTLISEELNDEVIRAATIEDLFEHIKRTRNLRGYGAGKKLRDACEAFVQAFFDDIYYGVYGGKPARLLNHEKILRSAYHFYLQDQYRNKPLTETEAQSEELTETETETASL